MKMDPFHVFRLFFFIFLGFRLRNAGVRDTKNAPDKCLAPSKRNTKGMFGSPTQPRKSSLSHAHTLFSYW